LLAALDRTYEVSLLSPEVAWFRRELVELGAIQVRCQAL
jgi:hypothetical protein